MMDWSLLSITARDLEKSRTFFFINKIRLLPANHFILFNKAICWKKRNSVIMNASENFYLRTARHYQNSTTGELSEA